MADHKDIITNVLVMHLRGKVTEEEIENLRQDIVQFILDGTFTIKCMASSRDVMNSLHEGDLVDKSINFIHNEVMRSSQFKDILKMKIREHLHIFEGSVQSSVNLI